MATPDMPPAQSATTDDGRHIDLERLLDKIIVIADWPKAEAEAFTRATENIGKAADKLDALAAKQKADAGKPVPPAEPAKPKRPDDELGIGGMFGGMAEGAVGNMYKAMFERLEAGHKTEAGGIPSDYLRLGQMVRERGGLGDIEQFKAFVKELQSLKADKGTAPADIQAMMGRYVPTGPPADQAATAGPTGTHQPQPPPLPKLPDQEFVGPQQPAGPWDHLPEIDSKKVQSGIDADRMVADSRSKAGPPSAWPEMGATPKAGKVPKAGTAAAGEGAAAGAGRAAVGAEVGAAEGAAVGASRGAAGGPWGMAIGAAVGLAMSRMGEKKGGGGGGGNKPPPTEGESGGDGEDPGGAKKKLPPLGNGPVTDLLQRKTGTGWHNVPGGDIAEPVVRFARELHAATDQVVAHNRALGEFSVSQAHITGQKEVYDFLRNMERGEKGAESARYLMESERAREDSLKNIRSLSDKVENYVAGGLNRMEAVLLKPINYLAERLEATGETIEKNSGAITGLATALGFAVGGAAGGAIAKSLSEAALGDGTGPETQLQVDRWMDAQEKEAQRQMGEARARAEAMRRR